MNGIRTNRRLQGWTWAAMLLGLVVGVGLGDSLFLPRSSEADVRHTTPRAAFLSGGERSEKVLVEISETLKRIDQRLQRLEKHILK